MIGVQEFKKKATIKQRILLERLLMNSDRERELENAIDWIEGENLSYEDALMIFNIDEYYQDLRHVNEKIIKNLQKAIEYGMGDVDLVALNYEDYTGITLEKAYL